MPPTNEFETFQPTTQKSDNKHQSALYDDAYNLPKGKNEPKQDVEPKKENPEPKKPEPTQQGAEPKKAGAESKPDGNGATNETDRGSDNWIEQLRDALKGSIEARERALGRNSGVTEEDRNVARLMLAQKVSPLISGKDAQVLGAMQDAIVSGDLNLFSKAVNGVNPQKLEAFARELYTEFPQNSQMIVPHDGSLFVLDGQHAVQVRPDGSSIFRMNQKDNVVTMSEEDQRKLQPVFRAMSDKFVENLVHPERTQTPEQPRRPGDKPQDGPGHQPSDKPHDKPECSDQPNKPEPKKEADKKSEDLWGGKPWNEAIKAEGVEQGGVGDCFFMATLSGLANSDKGREKIHNMIREESDGSYTVTFPGAKDEPIKVTKKDLEESKGNSGQDKWAFVAETAFLKYTNDTPIVGGILHQQDIPTLGRATTPRGAMKLLTGEDQATDQFDVYSLGARQLLSVGKTSKENVGRDLEEAMKNERVVTASASPNFVRFLGLNDAKSLPDAHVYTVLDYDADKKMVTVRNPWASMGNGPLAEAGATKDGVTHLGDGKLQMSLDTFYNRFSQMDISGKNPELNAITNAGRSQLDSFGAQVDAANDLIHGRPLDALGNLVDSYNHQRQAAEEGVYAVSSTTWHQLTDHPGRFLFPGLPGANAPVEIISGVLKNPGDAPGVVKDVIVSTAINTVTAPVTAPINAGKKVINVVGGLLG